MCHCLKNVPFYYLSEKCPKVLSLKYVHLKCVHLKSVRLKNVAAPGFMALKRMVGINDHSGTIVFYNVVLVKSANGY